MNKKPNRVPSAGTKAEKCTKDETQLPSSPTIGKPHVQATPAVGFLHLYSPATFQSFIFAVHQI